MSFLSKLFGSNSDSKKNVPKQEIQLTDEEKKLIETSITELNAQLDSAVSDDEKADILNNLGIQNQKIGHNDEAIKNFEESMKIKEAFGPAFDGLTKLYNEQRKEAAFNKDDAQIQYWVKKTDDLLAQSKKIMRSR